jgi:diguanylate cyclase (GGDEF)-like protein
MNNNTNQEILDINEKEILVFTKDNIQEFSQKTLFRDRLNQSIAFARRHKFNVAVLAIDLDTFKSEDDAAFSEINEKVLNEIGKRVVTALRETDTISAQGVDEFVVILPDIKEEADAFVVANKIVEILSEPFKAGDAEIYIEPYIGIAIYPTDTMDANQLLTYANMAMVEAKAKDKIILRLQSVEEVSS